MKRRPILAGAGFVLAAFGLGMWLGLRIQPRPINRGVSMMAEPSSRSPQGPVVNTAPCVDFRHADPLVGKNGCVAGLVLRVYAARTGNTFLDFCEDYRTCPFSSVVFASDKSKFGDLGSLQGKRVEIRGDVTAYQGRAEIIVRDPQQVRSAP